MNINSGRSQSTATWRARPSAVLRALMSQGYALSLVTGIPALFAIAEGNMLLVASLLVPCALFTGLGYVSLHHKPPSDLRNIEAVCTLAGLFLIITIAPVPAFITLGMPVIDAFFEATSGTTSTGLSVASNTMNWPLSGHVLRAWIQWIGGFAIALAGVATIIGPRTAVKKMGQLNFDQLDILTSARLQAQNLLKVYCVITVVSIFILVLVMPSWWEAFVIALSAVSTGGFTPRPDSLASYSIAAQVLVMLICLSTTVTMLFYVIMYRDGVAKAAKATNAIPIAITAIVGSCLAALLVIVASKASISEALNACLHFLSGFSTAGFSVSSIHISAPTTVLILAIMVIGGGAGSTAGGIKIDRIITMLAIIRTTVNTLRSPPHAVFKVKENGKWMSSNRLNALIAVVLCYFTTLVVCWIIFVASGQAPFNSLFEVVSALSTVGLSSGLTSSDMPSHLKFVLMVAMLLGRLEFLALLIALSPLTWLKRS